MHQKAASLTNRSLRFLCLSRAELKSQVRCLLVGPGESGIGLLCSGPATCHRCADSGCRVLCIKIQYKHSVQATGNKIQRGVVSTDTWLYEPELQAGGATSVQYPHRYPPAPTSTTHVVEKKGSEVKATEGKGREGKGSEVKCSVVK